VREFPQAYFEVMGRISRYRHAPARATVPRTRRRPAVGGLAKISTHRTLPAFAMAPASEFESTAGEK